MYLRQVHTLCGQHPSPLHTTCFLWNESASRTQNQLVAMAYSRVQSDLLCRARETEEGSVTVHTNSVVRDSMSLLGFIITKLRGDLWWSILPLERCVLSAKVVKLFINNFLSLLVTDTQWGMNPHSPWV